ncbi:ABC transporter substrate-binding protein [Haloterrigena sp. SYSU A121-1]|uniref:ABC transporter substrate-binding protein n=1 Tax=Haloterrigena gelatinilytica TaxID=2741724 RepID=A0A8J8GSB4_9EURY|nr:ABC transporter substrate-binding protein [Haloterrigena gelatinilytica]NUB93077.1 ABC transporter substrate-binding protein [Haloterrigena gelatinilytica]
MLDQRRRTVLKRGTAVASLGLSTAGCLDSLAGSGGLESLSVAYVPIYPNMHHYVMSEEGPYDDVSADVTPERFASGPDVVKAFAGDEIDVAFFGITPAMVLVDRGKAAGVLTVNSCEGFRVMGTSAFATLCDEHGRDAFSRFESREGRKPRIGAAPDGSVPDVVLRYWIERDLDLGELDSVVSKSTVPPARTPQAMASGDLDATMIQEPYATAIGDGDGDFQSVAWSGDVFPDHPVTVMFAQERVLEATDLSRELVSAHLEATEFIRENPETAAEHASAVIGSGTSDERAAAAMESKAANFYSDPHRITDPTERIAEYVADVGNTDAVVSTEELFHFDAYDAVRE